MILSYEQKLLFFLPLILLSLFLLDGSFKKIFASLKITLLIFVLLVPSAYLKKKKKTFFIHERQKQAPRREPDVRLNPRTPGSHPQLKTGAKPLSHPGISEQLVLKLESTSASPSGLVKTQTPRPYPQFSNSADQGQVPFVCIPNKFPSNANTITLETTLQKLNRNWWLPLGKILAPVPNEFDFLVILEFFYLLNSLSQQHSHELKCLNFLVPNIFRYAVLRQISLIVP